MPRLRRAWEPLIAQSGCRMSNLLMVQGVEVFFFLILKRTDLIEES